MMSRFAPVFSRLSIVSALALSGLAVTACNGGAATTAAPAAAAEAQQAAPTTAQHGPGRWMFRHVEALDLRPEQRASVADVEQNLRADLLPHHETLRQVAGLLADSIEAGKLEPSDAAAQQAALTAAALDAKASFATAMNALHDALDADQRTTLVARLQAEHQGRPMKGAESVHHDGPLARLAFEIGLSDEQKASLKDSVQSTVEQLFPDRKARREASEAKMKAIADAFVSDSFDAADFDMWGDAGHSLESFTEVTTRAVAITERVLSVSQRELLASAIRSHAAKL
jgi:Spy/CpxP family protein refolding chaperone